MHSNLVRTAQTLGAAFTLVTSSFGEYGWRDRPENADIKRQVEWAERESAAKWTRITKNDKTSHVNTLEDAEQFIKLMDLPDKSRIPDLSPTPQEVLHLAPLINNIRVSDSYLWRLSALGYPDSSDMLESEEGPMFFCRFKWAEVAIRTLAEGTLDSGKVDYDKLSTDDSRHISCQFPLKQEAVRSPFWDTDPLLKKAQQLFLEIPEFLIEGASRSKVYTEEDIEEARENAFYCNINFMVRAIDLDRTARGVTTLSAEMEQKEKKAKEARDRIVTRAEPSELDLGPIDVFAKSGLNGLEEKYGAKKVWFSILAALGVGVFVASRFSSRPPERPSRPPQPRDPFTPEPDRFSEQMDILRKAQEKQTQDTRDRAQEDLDRHQKKYNRLGVDEDGNSK